MAKMLVSIPETEINKFLLEASYTSILVTLNDGGIILSTGNGTNQNDNSFVSTQLGNHFSCFFTDTDRQNDLPDYLLSKARSDLKIEHDCSLCFGDSSAFSAHLVIQAIRDAENKPFGFILIVQDNKKREKAISTLNKTATLLAQSQKMDAIGNLSGSIAHDFNNILTVIINNLDFLARKEHDDRATHWLDNAQQAAAHGSKLTQQLLTFSRRHPLKTELCNVNDVITGFESILRRACGESIEFLVHLDQRALSAPLDSTQLETALLNLVVNARDAMPNGGKLALSTRIVLIEKSVQKQIREKGCASELCPINGSSRLQLRGSHNSPASIQSGCAMRDIEGGSYIMVALKDSGHGIPRDVLAQIFDPFFSTKDVGKGTGLGLSQVYSFVMQSKGHIAIDSVLNQGTTVRFYLPAAESYNPYSQI